MRVLFEHYNESGLIDDTDIVHVLEVRGVGFQDQLWRLEIATTGASVDVDLDPADLLDTVKGNPLKAELLVVVERLFHDMRRDVLGYGHPGAPDVVWTYNPKWVDDKLAPDGDTSGLGWRRTIAR